MLVLVAPLVDLTVRLVEGRREPRAALRGWWSNGIVTPLMYAIGLACVLGAGVDRDTSGSRAVRWESR